MSQVFLPDYDNCVVNLANSILKYFTGQSHHKTLPQLDKIINERQPKQIILLVVDGLGSKVLEKIAGEDSILRRHQIAEISAVFPPTTVASTTALITGRYPVETDWLGWDQYVPPLGFPITIFRNVMTGTKQKLADEWLHKKYLPVEAITDRVGGVEVLSFGPIANNFINYDEGDLDNLIDTLMPPRHEKYIYAYYSLFDTTEHHFGANSPESRAMLARVEDAVEKLSARLPADTMLIITADHGHHDIDAIRIARYKTVTKMLRQLPLLEGRTTAWFVRPEYRAVFPEIFKEKFGPDFVLLDKDTVIEKHLFGHGPEHPFYRDTIGDFLSIATGDGCFVLPGKKDKKTSHAGGTADEVLVPLIVLE